MSSENAEKETMIDLYDGGLSSIVPEAPPQFDSIHKPKHYQSKLGFQAIDVIESFELNYRLGNVCKYILRANNKHETPKEDLMKALWYLAREIKANGHSAELKEFFIKQANDIK